jgi:hypothetical protein
VRHLTFRVRHEHKNFEMAKLPADSASARAGMDKLCPSVRHSQCWCRTSAKNVAYQCRIQKPAWYSPQVVRHDRNINPHCGSSNPHSYVARSDSRGTRRGFLPRGLYDAHPLMVIGPPVARHRGRASYNP